MRWCMQGPQPSAWHRERTPSTLALSFLSLNNAVAPQGITTPGPSTTVMVGHTASLWAPGFRTGLYTEPYPDTNSMSSKFRSSPILWGGEEAGLCGRTVTRRNINISVPLVSVWNHSDFAMAISTGWRTCQALFTTSQATLRSLRSFSSPYVIYEAQFY